MPAIRICARSSTIHIGRAEKAREPYEKRKQESETKHQQHQNQNQHHQPHIQPVGQKQRHLRWKPFHALFMLFINALCVVCATINSSKNGCFSDYTKKWNIFPSLPIFRYFSFCYRYCCCSCCCCLFFIFILGMERNGNTRM